MKTKKKKKKKVFIKNRVLVCFPQMQVKTKKKVFIENRTLFSPIFAQMHTYSNYWGDISPPCFGTPDSVTWGAEINFWEAREVYLCEFERDTRNLFQYGSNEKGEDQKKVFSTKISTNSRYRLKVLAIFQEFLSKDQKKEKKRSRPKSFMKSGVSSKITKIWAVNTNLGVLGLDLHSSSPEPVNFFGAQSSLGGGHNFRLGGTSSHLGGHGPGMPPVAPGLSGPCR